MSRSSHSAQSRNEELFLSAVDFEADLRRFRTLAMLAIANRSPNELVAPCGRLVAIFKAGQASGKALNEDALSTCQSLASLIAAFAAGMMELEEDKSVIVGEMLVRRKVILSTLGLSAFVDGFAAPSDSGDFACFARPSSYKLSHIHSPSHDLPLREWFLSHLGNPIPNPTETASLLTLVPSSTTTKIKTWFCNQRARTGWIAIKKKYAGNDTKRMVALVEAGEASWEESMREEVEVMITKIRREGGMNLDVSLKRVLGVEDQDDKDIREAVGGIGKGKRRRVDSVSSSRDAGSSKGVGASGGGRFEEDNTAHPVQDDILVGEDAFNHISTRTRQRTGPSSTHRTPTRAPATREDKGKRSYRDATHTPIGLGIPSSSTSTPYRQLSSDSDKSLDSSPFSRFSSTNTSTSNSTLPSSCDTNSPPFCPSSFEFDFPLPPSTTFSHPPPLPPMTSPPQPSNEYFTTFHEGPYNQQLFEITGGEIDLGGFGAAGSSSV